MSEWLKEYAWKAYKRETVSRVRIPSSLQIILVFLLEIKLSSIISIYYSILAKISMIDREKFKELYEEYKDLVYNLNLHYLQNKEESEDITQDVFIKLFKNIHKYDSSSSSLKTWIYRITINTCLDHIKSKKTSKRFAFITSIFSSDKSLQLESSFYHPGIQLEHKQALQKLLQQINQLPEQQKTALILTKIEDRSQQEVAEIMNLSVKAVESLLSRAKNNLKKYLDYSEG